MVIFNSYVSLPEGKFQLYHVVSILPQLYPHSKNPDSFSDHLLNESLVGGFNMF